MGIFKIIGGIVCTLLAIAAVALMVVAGLEHAGVIGVAPADFEISTVNLIIAEFLLFTMVQVNLVSVYLFGFKRSVTNAIVKKTASKK